MPQAVTTSTTRRARVSDAAPAIPSPARRGFLRSLAALPLIGGGVTLLGNPTRAAEPVTAELLDSYDAWLFYERRYLSFERFGPGAIVDNVTGQKLCDHVAVANAGGRFHGPVSDPMPSSRAAVGVVGSFEIVRA
jgi:hypothetical protein